MGHCVITDTPMSHYAGFEGTYRNNMSEVQRFMEEVRPSRVRLRTR